jgi:phosphate transport system ATP-binding protein
VLLCDEVTSALDPVSAESVEKTLKRLKSEYTIILVTHSMAQARRLADEVVFLYLGEVIESNGVRSFFEDPQQKRTRAFIGGPTPVDREDIPAEPTPTPPNPAGGEGPTTGDDKQ